jgi:adenine-specific DNA-methyltransferase
MNMHPAPNEQFRPIQYLGNKSRLLDVIASAVESVTDTDARVADLFSGTSVVGRRLAARNPVTAVDVQGYAAALGRAMLLTDAADLAAFDEQRFLERAADAHGRLRAVFRPLIEQEERAISDLRKGWVAAIEEIIEGGSVISRAATGRTLPPTLRRMVEVPDHSLPDATAAVSFGGVYFSYDQALWLDALHDAARSEPQGVRDVLIAATLGTCSEVVNTVGKQFAQPVRLSDRQGNPKPLLIERTLRDRGLDVRQRFLACVARWRLASAGGSPRNRVAQMDVDTFLRSSEPWDAAYADPPYTIDHYSRFYHVLETLVRRDRPSLSRMKRDGVPTIMRGLYRDDRYQSDFCVPSQAPGAFARLFEATAERQAPLVLSYSGHANGDEQRARLLSIDDLAHLARRSFRSVEIVTPAFEGHRKLNAARRNATTEAGSERLLICRS